MPSVIYVYAISYNDWCLARKGSTIIDGYSLGISAFIGRRKQGDGGRSTTTSRMMKSTHVTDSEKSQTSDIGIQTSIDIIIVIVIVIIIVINTEMILNSRESLVTLLRINTQTLLTIGVTTIEFQYKTRVLCKLANIQIS